MLTTHITHLRRTHTSHNDGFHIRISNTQTHFTVSSLSPSPSSLSSTNLQFHTRRAAQRMFDSWTGRPLCGLVRLKCCNLFPTREHSTDYDTTANRFARDFRGLARSCGARRFGIARCVRSEWRGATDSQRCGCCAYKYAS